MHIKQLNQIVNDTISFGFYTAFRGPRGCNSGRLMGQGFLGGVRTFSMTDFVLQDTKMYYQENSTATL